MSTRALNVDLTTELRRYIKDQVRSGRYQNESEIVGDAIRQMRQRPSHLACLLYPAKQDASPAEKSENTLF